MSFVKVAETSELTVGKKKKIVVGGRDILLSNVDGVYYAISDKCPHLGGSLYEGKLEGSTITCPKHGAKFDVRTGKEVADAKILLFKIKVKDDSIFTVKLEGEDVLVELD